MTATLNETHRAPFLVHASVCLALGILGPASGAAARSSRSDNSNRLATFSQSLVYSSVAPQPLFRLGNAARPFGWSTVIGDFDRDGKPDVVVADHIGRQAGGYAYRIEFSLSRSAPAAFTFESADDAVTIRTVDIDHDNDLDIIVGRPQGGDAVGVWLNDGDGHFTLADVRRFPSAAQALPTLQTTDPHVNVTAVDFSPRRAHDALPAILRATFSDVSHHALASHQRGVWCVLSVLQTAPRAPPQSSCTA